MPSPRTFDYSTLPRLHEMYMSGMSCSDIVASEAINTTESALRSAFRRHGFTTRTRSQAMKARWDSLDKAGRDRLVADAHEAVRGTKRTRLQLLRRAELLQQSIDPTETEHTIARALEAHGLSVVYQYAIEIYNVDIWITEPRCAVEIIGGGYNTRVRSNLNQRRKTVMSYAPLVEVRTTFGTCAAAIAENIVSWLEIRTLDPSTAGEYRVIRGDGQTPTLKGANADRWARVLSPDNLPKRSKRHKVLAA